MPLRAKKLVGFALFLPALIIYFLAVALLADFVPDTQLLKFPYFLIAGVAWAFPAKHLFQWMNAEPQPPQSAPNRD